MCLSSLVGVKGACNNTLSYPYFIEDIPGIDLKKAAHTSDTTGIELLQKSIDNGAKQVKQDIQHELIGKFRLNEKINGFEIGKFLSDYTSVVKSGFHFEYLCHSCRLSSLFITTIDFQTKEDFTGKVVIEIGNETFEYSVINTAKKRSYVIINKLIQTNEFKVYIEEENGNSFDLLNTTAVCNCENANVKLIGNGLIKINGYWQCDLDRLFCEIKDLFGRAVWYASGVYFYDELSMTDRINYYTVYKSQEDAVEQKHILNGRYQKEIKLISTKLYPLLKKLGGCCVDCSGSGWFYNLP
jgi:hypothetical protein